MSALKQMNVLWISDSVYSFAQFNTSFPAAFTGYNVAMDHGNYGGTTVGSGLMDVADESYYWNGTTWVGAKRGTPFGNYQACAFAYGRNDANNAESLTAFRKAYDKLVSQARKYIPVVVAAGPPPKTDGGVVNWDGADPYQVNSYRSTLLTIAAKYNVPFVDHCANFKSLVTLGTNTVAQLMRDPFHPSDAFGIPAMCPKIAAPIIASLPTQNAAPEIAGKVVNYYYGQPSGGSWTLGASGGSSPIPRTTGQAEQMLSSSTLNDVCKFPSSTCSQVWAHFFMNQPGGQVTIYVDRGLAGQQSITFDTSTRNDGVMNSVLVADGLSAGPHLVEMQLATGALTRVVGITYVGVT
jgi:hypothetical protein